MHMLRYILGTFWFWNNCVRRQDVQNTFLKEKFAILCRNVRIILSVVGSITLSMEWALYHLISYTYQYWPFLFFPNSIFCPLLILFTDLPGTDLGVLIDASRSIRRKFLKNLKRRFLPEFFRRLDIGFNRTRVAVASFHTESEVLSNFV